MRRRFQILPSIMLWFYPMLLYAESRGMRLQKQILQSRLEIERGKLEYTLEMWREGLPKDNFDIRVLFDPEKLIVDKRRSEPVGDAPVALGDRRILITPSHYTEYMGGVVKQGNGQIAVQHYKAGTPQYDRQRELSFFDPRAIGIAPIWHSGLPIAGLRTLLLSGDMESCGIDSNSRGASSNDDEEIWISYRDGSRLRLNVIPSKNHFVQSSQLESDGIVDRVECDPKQYGSFWFPQEIRYSRSVSGKIISSEVYRFRTIEFNDEFKETIDIQNLEIPAGYNFLEIPHHPSGQRSWDGEKLIQRKMAASSTPREKLFPWPWMIAGTTFAILAGYFYYRSRKSGN